MDRKDKSYLAFIPIPTLVVVISVLYFIVKPSLFYEPPWLLPLTNAVFVTVVFLIVAYIAMRNYKATGRIQILLLGCGVLAFGIGGVVAGFVRSIPGAGANLNVTIYNTGALIGALFHFAAALILLAGISPEVGSERKGFWLVFSYVGLTVFMVLFTIASLRGSTPPFFIQGVGPTALRQWVLGSADILFAFSFFIFMGSYLRNGEVFLYWYSSALALTSISLTAFFIESAVGSPIGWSGRFSQYLGGIYFLVAVITAIRSAKARRTSFDHVLTASLSPAEEKFRALAEHSPDMIERFDKEMKHVYVNQAGLRLYGKSSGSIIGKNVQEVGLTGSYVNLLKKRIQRVFETTQPMKMEHYIPTENGTRYYQSHCVPEFGVDGTVANVLVVSHDLTERKQAEEALRESEERYRSLFNGMTEGFALHEIICDEKGVPCDYRFLEINPAFERLTGLRRENVIGNTMSQVLPNDDPKWVKIYGEVALTGKSIHFDNYSPVLKRHFEVFAYCPAPRQFGVLFMDITERKQMEEKLRRSRDELELRVRERTAELKKANAELGRYNMQLEALNKELQDFAFVASHDLQEPLRKVRTFADMLVAKCGVSLDEASKDYLMRMQTAAARMQNLLNSLLAYSRLTTKEETRKETDLRKSAEAALSNLEITIKEKDADVEVGDLPTVKADRVQMIQLFQNLIGNALKFHRDGKPPHVKIYAQEVQNAKGAYEICVEDDGIGFDERYVDKIFLPFQRLHGITSEYEGVGMGLAICKKIVERHGGKITARSELGKGSTIIVTLPAEREVR